jgi:hypothetical protein
VGADAKWLGAGGKAAGDCGGDRGGVGLILDADHAADVVLDGLRFGDLQFAGEVVADDRGELAG